MVDDTTPGWVKRGVAAQKMETSGADKVTQAHAVAVKSFFVLMSIDKISSLGKPFMAAVYILLPVVFFTYGFFALYGAYRASKNKQQKRTKIIAGLLVAATYFAVCGLTLASYIMGSPMLIMVIPAVMIGVAIFGCYREYYVARQQRKAALAETIQKRDNETNPVERDKLNKEIKDLESIFHGYQGRRVATATVAILAYTLIAFGVLVGAGFAGPLAITGYVLLAGGAAIDLLDRAPKKKDVFTSEMELSTKENLISDKEFAHSPTTGTTLAENGAQQVNTEEELEAWRPVRMG